MSIASRHDYECRGLEANDVSYSIYVLPEQQKEQAREGKMRDAYKLRYLYMYVSMYGEKRADHLRARDCVLSSPIRHEIPHTREIEPPWAMQTGAKKNSYEFKCHIMSSYPVY